MKWKTTICSYFFWVLEIYYQFSWNVLLWGKNPVVLQQLLHRIWALNFALNFQKQKSVWHTTFIVLTKHLPNVWNKNFVRDDHVLKENQVFSLFCIKHPKDFWYVISSVIRLNQKISFILLAFINFEDYSLKVFQGKLLFFLIPSMTILKYPH